MLFFLLSDALHAASNTFIDFYKKIVGLVGHDLVLYSEVFFHGILLRLFKGEM